MKKIGFTLSELIVAVSIIGVAAALVIPTVGKFLPDVKKTAVLKYYGLIDDAIVKYYASEYYDKSIENCRGITCFNGGEDYNNFGEYLGAELGLDDNNIGSDGVSLEFDPTESGEQVVTIDTNPSAEGCFYNPDCTDLSDVDTFIFNINKDGDISPVDALTEAYFKNQYSMNNKEKDIQEAKKIIQKPTPKE